MSQQSSLILIQLNWQIKYDITLLLLIDVKLPNLYYKTNLNLHKIQKNDFIVKKIIEFSTSRQNVLQCIAVHMD